MFELNSLLILYLILGVLVTAFLAVFLYFWLRHRHRVGIIVPRMRKSVFLEVQVPKESTQENVSEDQRRQLVAVAEQIYTTLSEAGRQSGFFKSNDYISFEIAAVNKKISFYINCSRDLQDLIEKQIHAQYPSAQIEEVFGYNPFAENSHQSTAELVLQKDYIYPIRTYKNTESDPLNAITNAMSKLDENQGAVVQMVIAPAGKEWQARPRKIALEIQQGKTPELVQRGAFSKLMSEMMDGILGGSKKKEDLTGAYKPITLTPMQQDIVKKFEEKASRAAFKTNIRIITSAESEVAAEGHMRNIISSFMQYSMPPFNGFRVQKRDKKRVILEFIFRAFNNGSMLLNTEELASIWHLPTAYTETPNIKWLMAKKAAPPVNMPKEGLLLGHNIYRNIKTEVRISKDDRRRHMYIIGRTGTGKSQFLSNMVIQDILNGEGVCVVDPHGDLIEEILRYIPKERSEDVILFEPFDTERPMGLNMLEVHSEEQKDFAVQEMIAIFYKLVTDPQMLGPVFEHNMRNAMLTLMADEQYPGTIADIPKIFTDTEFQKYKVSKVNDPVVRAFWEKEMAKTSDHQKGEMLGYLVSKVGRFVENATMRNIIGQSKSAFDFRKVMDEGKILLLNLAKGKVGEINAKLLGLIIVSKLQMAALSRADIAESERKDFYLYVDEFQNFITESFASILSEARKYRLNLIVAHQYLGQLEQAAGTQGSSANVRDAVFGNAGTEVCFRIGVEDAETMAKEFKPVFNEFDLINIDRYNAYLKLMINGTASKPFNMQTLPPKIGGSSEMAAAVRQLSRLKYGKARAEVESYLSSSDEAAREKVTE